MNDIGQAAFNLWYLIPLLLITLLLIRVFFKSAYFKGKLGEAIVNSSITKKLNPNIYHLLKDVTLPVYDGTTQIDHIIVSIYGIFVIETKNMKGWIFGGEKQKVWTQKIYKQTNKFQNPIHQNYKHIKALSTLLNIGEDKIYSVIIFIGESTFKTPMPENVLDHGYIKYIESKKNVLFSKDEVHQIIEQIQYKQLERSFKTNKDHIRRLKEKKNCPKCGSLLTKRIAKKGIYIGQEFYGCSNFPRCKYVSPVTRHKPMKT